jgi:hypothetical protein
MLVLSMKGRDLMTMSDGKNSLTRIEFDIVKSGSSKPYSSLAFSINPQSIQESTAARTSLPNTRTANVIQDFGKGIKTFQIAGTTGYLNRTGKSKIDEMRDFFDKWMGLNSDNIGNDYQLIFHDYTSDHHWKVAFSPNGYSITQDVKQPLMYNYSLSFYVVSVANKASASEISQTTTGNNKTSVDPSTNTDNQYDKNGNSDAIHGTSGSKSSTKNNSVINPNTSSQSALTLAIQNLNKIWKGGTN